MRTFISFFRRGSGLPRFAAAALLGSAPALHAVTPTATVFVTSSVSSTNTNSVTFTNSLPSNTDSGTKFAVQITGLSAGATVQVNRYRDPSGSGVLDTTQPLVQSFTVTDGQVTAFGSVTDPRIPGDTDGVSGQITAKFSIPSQSWQGQLAGSYVIDVVSSTISSGTATASLTITQPTTNSQSISGQILNGSSGVAGAAVLLFSKHGNGPDFVSGVVADATGHYSIGAAPGSYVIYTAAPGLLGPAPFSLPTLVSGVNLTGQNITLTPASCTISSQVQSTNGSTVLPGVQFYMMSNNTGLVSFGYSDVHGNVVIPVTSASDWSYSADENSLDSTGYLPPQNNSANFDTTNGSITPTPAVFGQFTPANALIYGTLTDQNGDPLAGVDVNDQDSNQIYDDDFLTNSSGTFFLLAAGPGSWQLQVDNKSLANLGSYVAPSSVNLTVASGTAYLETLTATLANTFLTGTVTENDNPLSGVVVDAQPQNGGNNIQATTDSNGAFSLAVSGGTWNISLDNSSADAENLVGPQLTETVSSGHTHSGINYSVLAATTTISGSVTNGSGGLLASNSNDSVFATATISGLFYNIYTNNLNNSGDYSIPLIDGVWTIGVSGPNGTLPGFLPVTVTISNTSGGNLPQNLAPAPVTATFSGTVTNNGAPLAGVLIDAQLQNENNNTFFQATTADNGTFTLGVSPGSWIIYLDSSSAAAHNLVVPQLSKTIATGVTLPVGTYPVLTAIPIVSGTVKDASGDPLPASDNVFATATINNLQYQADANLDDSGDYSLPLVNGVWSLTVNGPDGTPEGFQSTTVTVSNNQNQTVDLAPLVATATLSGSVTNNGMAVAGILVDAQQQNGNDFFQVTTNSDGNYSIGVVTGTWNVFVDGDSASEENLVTPASQLTATITTTGQTISSPTIPVLTGMATVSGTVEDAGGNLLSSSYNVSATATISGVQYDANTNVGDNGDYSLVLVPGTWSFNVSGPGGPAPNFQQTTLTVTGSQTFNLAPPTPTATFSGTVMNGTNPVSGLTVYASLQNNNGNNVVFQATTGSDGSFTLGVMTGSWNIYLDNNAVAQQNLIASNFSNVNIATGHTTPLTIQVQTASGTITGSVSDYNGNPVTNGFVYVNATATIGGVPFVSNISSNNSGTYSLPVVNGSWFVSPGGDGLNFNPQTVTVNGSAVANFTASVISNQPQNQTVTAGQDVGFFLGVNIPGSGNLQWQVSTNDGMSWTNLGNNLTYTGVTFNSLSINYATTALNGDLYRCVVSFTYNGNTISQTSAPASLTVNPATAGVTLGSLSQYFTGAPCSATATTNPGGLAVTFTYNGLTTVPTQAGSYTVVATINDPNYTGTATGTLTILPDFAFYLGKYFNTAQLTQSTVTGPNANPAGDGMPNLMKYALGLDPTKPDAAAGAPVVGQSGGFQTLTYLCPPGLTDVTYVVQVSSDLVTWNSGPSFTTTISNSLVGNQQQVVVRDLTPTSGTTRRFIRLEITQP
jgi:hypothetical protein